MALPFLFFLPVFFFLALLDPTKIGIVKKNPDPNRILVLGSVGVFFGNPKNILGTIDLYQKYLLKKLHTPISESHPHTSSGMAVL